jgi:prepilin-type N-terminal cleavage/methylation domain-containing protein
MMAPLGTYRCVESKEVIGMKILRSSRQRNQAGMSLIELMIALVVLAVGMLGVIVMVTTAIQNNTKNKQDNGGTMMAQFILEQIASIPANKVPAPVLVVTDCNPAGPQNWNINTTGGGQPIGIGALLIQPPNQNAGDIDWLNQAYGAVPAGYRMRYVSCGAGGSSVAYDVRWNVQVLPDNFTKLITVSARPFNLNPNAARWFARPVTLRTIGGI